jgi:plastocyanin
MTFTRRYGWWLAPVLVAAAALLSPATARAATTTAVQADNFRFCAGTAPVCLPTDTGFSVTVAAGDSVAWTYTDTACDLVALCPGHNVTFADGGGATMKSQGATLLTRTFTKAGTFNYTCTIHASFGMTGVIVVTPASAGGGDAAGPATPSNAATVVAAANLPRTGPPLGPITAFALEAVVAGALLLTLARRDPVIFRSTNRR